MQITKGRETQMHSYTYGKPGSFKNLIEVKE